MPLGTLILILSVQTKSPKNVPYGSFKKYVKQNVDKFDTAIHVSRYSIVNQGRRKHLKTGGTIQIWGGGGQNGPK